MNEQHDPWIEGPPTRCGLFVCWTKSLDGWEVVRVKHDQKRPDLLIAKSVLDHNSRYYPLSDFSVNDTISHHYPINPKPPIK